MNESASTSESAGLLSARNLILAAAAVLVLSLVGSCISLLRPADSGGLGRDSFGTLADGYRALFEVLEELGVPVSRDVAPPWADANGDRTLVLLAPDSRLVRYSPKYIQALLAWVDRGGRLLVAPSSEGDAWYDAGHRNEKHGAPPKNPLQLLALADQLTLQETSSDDKGTVPVECLGSLEPLAADVRRLAIPGDKYTTISLLKEDLPGSVRIRNEDGKGPLLAAVTRRGKGEIVVVSDPALLGNKLIGRADNSVLAAHLVSPQGQPVVFDEFYHGLAVRGNPLYLLTRPGFAAATLAILLVVGVWTWRSAVFLGPPLPEIERSRRDIGEYVNAMGAFFSRGRLHRRFLAREVRDGVLHQLCVELKLPPDSLDVESVCGALERRDPRRAAALRETLSRVDARLTAAGEYPNAEFLPNLQSLTSCL